MSAFLSYGDQLFGDVAADIRTALPTIQFTPSKVGAVADCATVDAAVRSSESALLPTQIQRSVRRRILLLSSRMERHFGLRVDCLEEPTLQRYGVGGHFRPHRDSNPHGEAWARNRRITIVIAVNDAANYVGGALHLDFEDGFIATQRMQAGTVIAFPSATLHAVDPIVHGERYSLVSWLSIRS